MKSRSVPFDARRDTGQHRKLPVRKSNDLFVGSNYSETLVLLLKGEHVAVLFEGLL